MYRPQTNGVIKAANKNIKRILRMMIKTSRDWSKKLPFALLAYRTSFRTSTRARPYYCGGCLCLSKEDGTCIQKVGQA